MHFPVHLSRYAIVRTSECVSDTSQNVFLIVGLFVMVH